MADRYAEARVFVVDDNPSNVALIRAVLVRAGFAKVFTELDSRQVQSRLPEVDPDLVILDLNMPYLDGFGVLEQIREFAPSAYLPVLVLTADATSAASERALGAGAQDFVTKPFNNTELLLRTRNLLETRFLYTTLRGSLVLEAAARELEEHRLTQALIAEQDAADQLRLLDSIKDTLMQTVSHDLRNPIAAVLTLTGILAADAEGRQPLSPAVRSAIISKVESSARKMDRLLKDLLDSDPMRKSSDHRVLCDVGDLVRRVLAEVDLGTTHPLHVDVAEIRAVIDPVHVERIVDNLLSNAAQHVAPGVPIWISAAPTDDGFLLAVEDAGPGVSPELGEIIFEPFRRGVSAPSGGLGLGLSLVRRFAEMAGGRAWVQHRVGGGASFRVQLPSGEFDARKHAQPGAMASRT